MKQLSWLTGILLPFQFAMAQPVTAVGIGNKLPTPVFNTIQNYPALKNTISPLSGKWLILDFMSTTCLSCIEAIPRLDSLQKQYQDKLQIMLITNQPGPKVSAFLQKHNALKNIILPVLTDGSQLSALFPHESLSHEVWIDPNGIVQAITLAQYVNNKNIDWALSSKPLRLPLKLDIERFFYDGSTALLAQMKPVSFYSALLPYNDHFLKTIKLVKDSASSASRLSLVNFSLLDLYRYSYGSIHHKPSQLVLDVKDTASFIYNSSTDYWEQWETKHSYGYESIMPAFSAEASRQKMHTDLDAWFGLASSMEKRVVNCYVLKETNEAKPVVAVISQSEPSLTIDDIIYILNEKYFHPPVVDERKNKSKLSTSIPKSALNNIPELQKQLAAYGLALFTEPKEILVLTISETKKPNN